MTLPSHLPPLFADASLWPSAVLLTALVVALAGVLVVRLARVRGVTSTRGDRRTADDALQVHLDVDERGEPLPAGRVDPTLAPCPKCGRFVPGPVGRRYCPADDLYF